MDLNGLTVDGILSFEHDLGSRSHYGSLHFSKSVENLCAKYSVYQLWYAEYILHQATMLEILLQIVSHKNVLSPFPFFLMLKKI
jgi:hypothetical protein